MPGVSSLLPAASVPLGPRGGGEGEEDVGEVN